MKVTSISVKRLPTPRPVRGSYGNKQTRHARCYLEFDGRSHVQTRIRPDVKQWVRKNVPELLMAYLKFDEIIDDPEIYEVRWTPNGPDRNRRTRNVYSNRHPGFRIIGLDSVDIFIKVEVSDLFSQHREPVSASL